MALAFHINFYVGQIVTLIKAWFSVGLGDANVQEWRENMKKFAFDKCAGVFGTTVRDTTGPVRLLLAESGCY